MEVAGSSDFVEWVSYLDPAERDIIILRFVEELSYEELAVALAIPIGTVKWRLFNAKKKLAPIIKASLPAWEFYERMATATRALTACGAGLRAAFALQDRRLNAGLRAVFAKINEGEAVKRERPLRAIQHRLDALAELMAPMCGSQTAIKALRAAAQVSPARSLESVTEDNWTSFLSSMKPIAAVMCGETGARLVWESGQL